MSNVTAAGSVHLNNPFVHVSGVEEKSIKVCHGGKEAAVSGDIAVPHRAVVRHKWLISETKPAMWKHKYHHSREKSPAPGVSSRNLAMAAILSRQHNQP